MGMMVPAAMGALTALATDALIGIFAGTRTALAVVAAVVAALTQTVLVQAAM